MPNTFKIPKEMEDILQRDLMALSPAELSVMSDEEIKNYLENYYPNTTE